MPPKQQPPVYVGGDDPELVAKRQAYEQALERLSRSLETRQQRTFDPALLRMGMAFLDPGKTGSFWEAAGRAAGAYSAGEEQQLQQQQDIAQQQLQVAQMGMDVERQRQQDIALRGFLGGAGAPPPTIGGGPLGAPQQTPTTGGLGAPTDTVAGAPPVVAGPLSRPPAGIQIAPEDPYRMTGRKFIELNKGSMPVQDLLKEAARIDAENTKITEKGRHDVAGGKFFPALTGQPVEKRIFPPGGKPETIVMTDIQAYALDQAAANNDPEAYQQIINQARFGPFARQASGQPAQAGLRMPAGAPDLAAPGAAPTTAAIGMGPLATAEPIKSVAETAAEAKAKEAIAQGRAEQAVKKEQAQEDTAKAAERLFATASLTDSLVKKNKDAFGFLQRPGVFSGLLNLVSTTKGVGPEVDQFVQQATLKGNEQLSQDALTARTMVTRNLAELALGYSQIYLKGQGAVSEYERRIVSQLSGTGLETPEAISSMMKLIKMRSQFEIDNHRRWQEYQENNPDKTISDYQRSKTYLNNLDNFNKQLGKAFGFEPAVPTGQKAGQFSTPQVQSAQQRLRQVWGQ